MSALTHGDYDFYVLDYNGRPFYNIVPRGSQPPEGGYGNREWIEHIKHVKFPLEML
jgi:hypothetical protein